MVVFYNCREQYVDLIAAADTIIDMEKKANMIQQKLERMQGACDVHAIQRQAALIHQSEEKEHSSQGKLKVKPLRHGGIRSSPYAYTSSFV
jgi:hypothetical protein